MNYYGYTFITDSDLAHHGILGQKWGIRRFQNKDGSLTNKGKSRYSKGKEIASEHSKLEDKEYQRLLSTDKRYKKAEKEANRLQEKYGLDADDGGGGDSTRWSEETLRRAGDRYWSLSEDMAALDDEFSEKAYKYADEKILKKYGDVGVSDMKYYQGVNSGIAATAFVASLGAILWLSKKMP